MSDDNVIKATKIIGRNGFTEYRVDVRSTVAIPDWDSHIPDDYVIAAMLANQLREFVNSAILDKHVEIAYRELGDERTCPCCGRSMEQ